MHAAKASFRRGKGSAKRMLCTNQYDFCYKSSSMSGGRRVGDTCLVVSITCFSKVSHRRRITANAHLPLITRLLVALLMVTGCHERVPCAK